MLCMGGIASSPTLCVNCILYILKMLCPGVNRTNNSFWRLIGEVIFESGDIVFGSGDRS